MRTHAQIAVAAFALILMSVATRPNIAAPKPPTKRPATQPAAAPRDTFKAVAAGRIGEPYGLSPDGRWLAHGSRLTFYDFTRRRAWTTTIRATAEPFWRADGRACAVAAEQGWAVVWPSERRVAWITRNAAERRGGTEVCAAWAPRTGRLAFFESEFSGGRCRIWDGKRIVTRLPWAERLKLPAIYGPWRAWQCAWSPDEQRLFFRFYGHAERDPTATAHLAVLNPATGRHAGKWRAEAGPTRWIGNSLVYLGEDDDESAYPPLPLMMADPKAGRERRLLDHTVAWTAAPKGDRIWALTADGALHELRPPDWKAHAVGAEATSPGPADSWSLGTTLHASPDSRSLAVWGSATGDTENGRTELVTVDLQTRSVRRWRAPHAEATLLGWPAGASWPVIAVPSAKGGWELRRPD